jgi:hypothetical protein
MRRFLLMLVLSAVMLPLAGTAQQPPEPIVERVLTRADEPLTRYRAMRRLEARNERHNLHAWMEVFTELSPRGFEYQVIREGGNEWMRKTILRPLLDREEELFAPRNARRAAFTDENYVIEDAGPAASGLVKLIARPKRRDVALVDGAIYVSEPDADVVRVEGKLARTPSFWMKQVDVVRHFQRIGGVNVPVRLDSVAHVRVGGPSTMTMTYDYVMVNGSTVAPANATASRNQP